ncbi:DUF2892 domain-containing protein [Persicobacter psychrovividus]
MATVKLNMGKIDRIVRGIIATIMIFLYLGNIITGNLGTLLLVGAGLLVANSLSGKCYFYSLMGWNSCQTTETAAPRKDVLKQKKP